VFSDGFVCFVCLNWVPVKTFTRVRICQGAEISTRSRPSGREFRYATFTSHGMGLIFRILNTFFKTPLRRHFVCWFKTVNLILTSTNQ